MLINNFIRNKNTSNNLSFVPPYIIAEIGVNHEGDMGLAKKIVKQAKNGGANAVKFQAYKANTLVVKSAKAYWDTSKEKITPTEFYINSITSKKYMPSKAKISVLSKSLILSCVSSDSPPTINDIPGFLNVNTSQFMDSEIKQYVGASGTSQLNADEPNDSILPQSFILHQNYPNPFNPSTVIIYDISVDAEVKASVINTKGQVVKILVNNWQSSGKKSLRWDATNSLGLKVPAGVYFIVLDVARLRAMRKMVLLK